jgi:hypothetical protein
MKWTRKLLPWLTLATVFAFLSISTQAQASGFSLAWQLSFPGRLGAEHPIIHNGVAYVPWMDETLSAITLTTGSEYHSLSGVIDATAPSVADNHLYSYDTCKTG